MAGNTPRCLNLLHDAVSKAVGARTFLSHIEHRNFAKEEYCGLCTDRWLDHKIRGRMLPTSVDEVIYLHEVARRQFADFVLAQDAVQRPWIWASGIDGRSHLRLKELLEQHGVPSGQLDTRIALLTQSRETSRCTVVSQSLANVKAACQPTKACSSDRSP